MQNWRIMADLFHYQYNKETVAICYYFKCLTYNSEIVGCTCVLACWKTVYETSIEETLCHPFNDQNKV